MKTVKKALPGGISEKIDDFWPYKTYTTITRKLEKAARKGVGKEKLKNYFKLHGIETAAQMGAESTEEVLQGMTQSIVAVGSQSLLDEWVVPDLNVGIFREGGHHGGWTQIRDEALGGALGGGVTSVTGAGKIVTGLNERSINKSLAKLARTKVGTHNYVRKRGYRDQRDNNKKKWTIATRVTEKDKDTGKITSDEISDISGIIKLDDGSTISADYDSFEEAFRAAESLNKAEANTVNKKLAWNLRNVNEGEVKVVKDKDEKFSLEIYDNDGKLYQKLEKKYDTQKLAEKSEEYKKIQSTIKKAKENYDKFGNVNLKEDPAIIEERKVRERKIQAWKNLRGIDDNATMDQFEPLRGGVAIALFLDNTFANSSQGLQELRDDVFEKEKNLNKDPNIILDYLEKDGDFLFNGVADENNTATQMRKEFEDVFKDRDDYNIHKARLEKILKPLIQKHDSKESLKDEVEDKGPITDEDLFIEDEGPVEEIITEEIPAAEEQALPITEDRPPMEEPIPTEEPIPVEEPIPGKGEKKAVAGDIKTITDKELASKIAQFKKQVDKGKKGTPERKIAEKMLSKLEKEQESRKKAPEVK